MDWNEIFEGKIPDDSIKFWQKLITIKNAAGDLLFEDLSLFAFVVLSLPSSNAVVERVFSIMNIIKSKLRNKMMLKMLNSVLFIKYHLFVNNLCCQTFEPSADMISRFNSNMYVDQIPENVLESELENAEEILQILG